MRLCRFQMAFPRFAKPLRERINEFWDGMAQKTPGLLKRLADPDECQDAQLEITEDLQKVVPGAQAYVGAIAALWISTSRSNTSSKNRTPARASL